MLLPKIEWFGIYNSRTVAPDGRVSKNRKTSMFELELPLTEGGISYLNGKSRPVRPDTLVCVKPGQMRHTRFPYQCYFIHMLIPDPKLSAMVESLPDFLPTENPEPFRELFARLCRFSSPCCEEDQLQLQSIVLELISRLLREAKKQNKLPSAKNGHFFEIEKVLSYVKENPGEDLSLKAVSAHFSFSPTYFHSLFKKALGIPLRQYVEEQRLKNAVDLLLTTDRTLADIALASGFSSQSYFSYVFQRKFKKTPRAYARDVYQKYES